MTPSEDEWDEGGYECDEFDILTKAELFARFVETFHDADPDDPVYENIMSWAWWMLNRFAERMGPEYESAVGRFWKPDED